MVRPHNMEHVEKLREGFLVNGKHFKILAAIFISGSMDKAEVPGRVTLEVLGGNHSREALASLYSSCLVDPLVLVTVYKNSLSTTECLSVAYQHNKVDELSLSMNFIDKCRILRKIKKRNKQWSPEASAIFGYKSNAEARAKLRTMAAGADHDEVMGGTKRHFPSQWTDVKPMKRLPSTFRSLGFNNKGGFADGMGELGSQKLSKRL
ncbi:uncharacterized protein LOC128548147 [Mercenaria mercenaria]|uniref:uncharacterized protein LOC128548147 n=1 Tax=Mercenaria mercenaria TaxID=6596 RepID=UPI00234F7C72|nr:uncharacterized protein LOC128548147 [Mercenaria mercenaria]